MKKPLRALVIEDSEFDALLLVNLLRQGGYDVLWKRVQTAEGMREALAAQAWDLVFSDHQMPGFNAPAALRILQEAGHDLPFIIVSGGIGEATAVAAMKAGAHDYLMKGQLGRLVPAVERELREAANREGRRQAELSMRESELRYRLLWENSPDAVVLMNEEIEIRFANAAVEGVFGYSRVEIIGMSFLDLVPDQMSAEKPVGLCCPCETGGGSLHRHMLETLGRHKDGREVPVEIGFSDMEMDGKRWFIAFIRDITERKRAERVLRATAEQFRVAREIQQRLFPKGPPALPGFDIAGASYPAEATGGDYFDYMPMLNEGVGIVVGDVTGHGIGPALLMAETRAYLRVVGMHRESVGEVLTRANRALAEDVGQELFVTVLLARLDAAQRTLTYVNAGHPPGYVLGLQGEIKTKLRRTNIPLGMRSDTAYIEARVALEPGDTALFLTDGFEEAVDPDNTLFGVERVLEVVRTNRHRAAVEIVEALRAAVQEFARGATQQDDLTVVVVKVLD